MTEAIVKNMTASFEPKSGESKPGMPKSGYQPEGQAAPKAPLQQAQAIADQALSAGRELKDRAFDLADTSTEAVKEQASEFMGAAKEFAAQAGEKIKESANEQKNAGATYIGNIADTMRRASHEFDNELPIAGVYIRKAASKVEEISDTLQHGDIQDLIASTQAFARRQPTAFLGLAVLAGFGAIRFLKSSSNTKTVSPDRGGGQRSAMSGDNKGYRDDFAS